jgi:cell division septation protein DedD
MSNRQVIALFISCIAVLLAGFGAGLYVMKDGSTANASQSQAAVQPVAQEQTGPNARFFVLVGDPFGTQDAASELVRRLRERKYLSAHTHRDEESQLRVRIGPYNVRADAEQVAAELSNEGHKRIMVRMGTQN